MGKRYIFMVVLASNRAWAIREAATPQGAADAAFNADSFGEGEEVEVYRMGDAEVPLSGLSARSANCSAYTRLRKSPARWH